MEPKHPSIRGPLTATRLLKSAIIQLTTLHLPSVLVLLKGGSLLQGT